MLIVQLVVELPGKTDFKEARALKIQIQMDIAQIAIWSPPRA